MEDSWEDPNLDEHGKALWGVPGAGTYETVASIGRTQVFPNAPTYTFGVHHRKNPFVSKQHDKNDYGGCDSPGPVYKPETRALSKSTRGADFSFGSADRGAGRLQYISKVRFLSIADILDGQIGPHRADEACQTWVEILPIEKPSTAV